jgi:hypothetical protein
LEQSLAALELRVDTQGTQVMTLDKSLAATNARWAAVPQAVAMQIETAAKAGLDTTMKAIVENAPQIWRLGLTRTVTGSVTGVVRLGRNATVWAARGFRAIVTAPVRVAQARRAAKAAPTPAPSVAATVL